YRWRTGGGLIRGGQENTKAWHFCFVFDIYKEADKHSRRVTHQRLVPKRFPIELSWRGTVPRCRLALLPWFFGCQLVDGN
ncbi:hypothetical protein KUCAC02_004314, partial [Chaenocephalus aceratus]